MESEPNTNAFWSAPVTREPVVPGVPKLSPVPSAPEADAVPPSDIVAFAKDWEDNATSNHHVLRRLAQTRRVLWLNSVGTRTPRLSGRDLGRAFRKLRQFARGPVNVENDLWVYTPLVAPFPHRAWARRLNELILRRTVRRLRRKLGLDDFQLWTFLPNTADYVGMLGESLAVYYCVDEFSLFSRMDGQATLMAEMELLRRVDCVFAVNEDLAEAKGTVNSRTFTAPHGVDHELFTSALDPSTPPPSDVSGLPGPIIGFYGTLEEWVDLHLMEKLARRHPEWSIVMIGPQLVGAGRLAELPNVSILGRRRHEDLPAYCRAFDVGLIPYRRQKRMAYVNPVKLREYLSAGLPVVSTDVREVCRYARWCAIAGNDEDFIAAVESALTTDSPELRRARSHAMANESWDLRVAELDRHVAQVAEAVAASP